MKLILCDAPIKVFLKISRKFVVQFFDVTAAAIDHTEVFEQIQNVH